MATDDILNRVAVLSNPRQFELKPIDLTRLSGGRMKGFSLLQLFDTVEALHGPEVVQSWREALPAGSRAQVDRKALTSVAWVDVELYYHLVTHVVDTRFSGDPRHAMALGAAVAAKEIGTFFKVVLGFTTPAMVLSLSGRFWRSYFDRGELKVRESKGNQVQVQLRDWPLHDAVSLHELVGSLVQWMESSRGKDVRLSLVELIAPGCLDIAASW